MLLTRHAASLSREPSAAAQLGAAALASPGRLQPAAGRGRWTVRCSNQQQQPQEDRPALYGEFVRRRSSLAAPVKRAGPCRRCAGTGLVPCAQCGGKGWLARGGYQKRNPINAARLVGSKWTAMERTFGWRHFRALEKRGQGKATLVLLQATCDESTQFWVNMQNLKDRDRWAAGWLQKQEIQAAEAQRQQQQEAAAAGRQQQQTGSEARAAAGGGTACKRCAGSGSVPCPLCSLAGQVVEL